MAKLTHVRASDIKLSRYHDPTRSTRGDMDALRLDILGEGFRNPILVTPSHIVVDGARRLAAVLENNRDRPPAQDKIPVLIVDNYRELFDELVRQGTDKFQLPYDHRRLYDFFASTRELISGERNVVAKRNLEYLNRGEEVPSPGRRINSRKRLSMLTGFSEHQIQVAVYLYGRYSGEFPFPEEVRPLLNKEVAEVENGKNIYAATREVRTAEAEQIKAETKQDQLFRTEKQQRDALGRSLAVLRSVARNLELLDAIDSGISPEEARAWRLELHNVKARIIQAMNKLHTREKGN